MAWNLYHSSTPPASAPVVGAGLVLFDSWTDVNGNQWAATSGLLNSQASTGYPTAHLTRPTAENQQDQRIVVAVTAYPANGMDVMQVGRRVDANNYYLVQWDYTSGTSGLVHLHKYVGGALTTLATSAALTTVVGHDYTLDFSVSGVNPTTISATVTDTTTSTALLTAFSTTDNTAALQVVAQYAISTNGSGNATGTASQISRIDLYDQTSGATLAASPSSVVVGSTGNAITLTGTGTAWTAGTPGTPTFTLSGGTGASITAQTVASATSATLTVTAGSATGTLTVTDPSTGATATITVTSAPPVTIPVTDANLVSSPYNWFVSGSAFMEANAPGAYVRLGFSGTSLKLGVDVSPLTGAAIGAADYPILRYSVDGGAWGDYQLLSTDTQPSLASGLAAGSHTLGLWLRGTNPFNDRWTTPANVLRITGFLVDGGAASVALAGALAGRGKRLILYHDSIGEGHRSLGTANPPANQDSVGAYGHWLADALDAEIGYVCYGAQGYVTAGAGNVPALSAAYDHYWSTQGRLVGGVLSPLPDYLLCLHGQNDGVSVTATQVQTQIAAFRTVAGAACWIVVGIPFSGTARAAITGGYSAYVAATPGDARVRLVDLGTLGQYGYAGSASLYSLDGVHPTPYGHARQGAMLAAAIKAAIDPTPRRVGLNGGM